MSTTANRYPSSHRSEPIREAVALRCKTLVCCSPPQREIAGIWFDSGHLGDVIVRQIGTIVMSNGRATIQIPIDRRLL